MATENLQKALLVLAIGMITVFIVLALVVLTGQLIIKAVNSLHQDRHTPKATSGSSIPPSHLVAITAAVEHIGRGKALIQKIENE